MTTLRFNPIPLVALVLAAVCLPALAQVPSEVTTLTWCAGPAKDCLQWSASAGATEYRLYRGELASLACLPNTARESCLESVLTGSTTGPGAITENPAAGRFYWYLLTAANAQAEGTSGTERLNGISQPRVRNSIGTCPVTCSPAGGGCSSASDCCSSACFAGCQAACCVPAGGTCTDYFDCCSGNCNGGTCQSCFALGQACVASAQCCSGGCTGGLCGVACQENGGACAGNAQCCSGNCSGGACQAPPTDDGVATPVPDLPHVASATIGAAGGSIQAGGMTLTIPPNALDDDTLITMTPLLNLADSPLSGTLIGGAVFEPSGLSFRGFATLTIPRPPSVAFLDVVGFGSESDGSDLHLDRTTFTGDSIELALPHFTTAGASSGGSAVVAALQTHPPSTAEKRAIQRIVGACRDCEAEQAANPQIVGGPGCARCFAEAEPALLDWYETGVKPGLIGAIGQQLDPVFDAIREWIRWWGEVQYQGLDSEFATRVNEGELLSTQALQNLANRKLQACDGTSLDAQVRDMLIIDEEARSGDLTLNPASPLLPGLCAHLAIVGANLPARVALDHDNTLTGNVVVLMHSGQTVVPSMPVALTVDGHSVGVAPDGSFSTTIHPTAGPTVVANMEVDGTTQPWVSLIGFDGAASISRPARARFDVSVRIANDTVFYDEVTIRHDGQGAVRARLAGDGLEGATVTYQLSGDGSLDTTTAVTSDIGRAPDVFYTPPANGGDITVTITASALGESGFTTIHVIGPTITSVSPSPLFGPPSGFDGVVLTGTVVIHGTHLQGGDIFTDGPLAMLGTATVDPTGTMIQKNYAIGQGVPNVPFHFIVATPLGTVQVDDTISTSTAGGPPLSSVSPSPVVFRCGVGLPPHTGTIVIQGSNLQGGEIVAAHAQYSDLRFFKLLGSSTVNGAGTTIQRDFMVGVGGGFAKATPMQFLVITPQGMSVVTGTQTAEDIFGACTVGGGVCHASSAGNGVYEVTGGGFEDAEIVNNDGTLIFTSEPRVGDRQACYGHVQTLQQDYILSSGASVGQHFNVYIVGPSGWICFVDQVIADAPDFCHCQYVPDGGPENRPLQCAGDPLPWP